jgi:MFS family permease
MIGRNVPLFLAFRATTRALLFAPYIQHFMVGVRGLSDAQYGALQAISYPTVVCAEIPSGVLADRIGRKWILISGAAVNAAGCWIFASTHGFWPFAVGEVCFALGTAFISGADSALLYDSLAAVDRSHEYARVEGAAQASWLLVTAVGLVTADHLLVQDGNPVLAYWVTGALSIAGAIVALALIEPPVGRRETTREITAGAFRDVVRVPGIARLIVYSIGIFALLRAAIVMFFNPALEDMGVPVHWYGRVLAYVNVVGAVAAWRSGWWMRRVGERGIGKSVHHPCKKNCKLIEKLELVFTANSC